MDGMAHGTCCQAQAGRLIKFLFQNNHHFSFGPPKGYPALKLRFVGCVPRTLRYSELKGSASLVIFHTRHIYSPV